MRTARWAWIVVVTVIAAWCAMETWRSTGPASLLAGVFVITAMGITLAFIWLDTDPPRPRLVLRVTAWSALAGTLVVGAPTAFGAWSVLVLTAVGLTSPPVIEAGARWLRAWADRRSGTELAELTTHDLLRRWRRTSDELVRAGSPERRLVLVEERAGLLDEIERRDPMGFWAWLAEDAWRELQGR